MDGEINFKARIDALAAWKLKQNQAKIGRKGYHDIDDHGYIPWPEPIPFERVSNHPDGGSYGIRCVGENFRGWLDVHPVLHQPRQRPGRRLDRDRSRGWAAGGPRTARSTSTRCTKSTRFSPPASARINHLGPDMTIGLELGWGGLLDKIAHISATSTIPPTPDFYDGEEDLVLGVQNWIRRHVRCGARDGRGRRADPVHRARTCSRSPR